VALFFCVHSIDFIFIINMRNQPIQPKKETRDFSVFKPVHQPVAKPVAKPAKVEPEPVAAPKTTPPTTKA